MKQEEIEYLDREFTVLEEVPSTAVELTAMIGEEAVVNEAVGNLYYRNKYPRVYKAVSAALVADHAFPKAVASTKKKADGTETNIHESANDHIRAFLSGRLEKQDDGTEKITTPTPAENRSILQALFDKVGTEQPLYVKGERTAAGSKVSAAATEQANKFFAMGPEKVEAIAGHIETLVPAYKVGRDEDGQVTADSLARAIQTLNLKMKRDAEAAAKATLNALG